MNSIYKRAFSRVRTMILSAAMAIIALTLGGCRQSEGNIGPWFGSWVIEEITVGGTADASYEGNVMVSFQGDMVDFGYVDGNDVMGTWSHTDNSVTFRCDYGEGTFMGTPELFNPFPVALGFEPGVGTVTLTVDGPSNGKMTWSRTDASGRPVSYRLRHIL